MEVPGENRFQYGALQVLVGMDGDVPESDHVSHGVRGGGKDEFGVFHQSEGIAAALGNAKLAIRDMVHGEVDSRFAGSEEIENDGVLDGEIVKPLGSALILFGNPRQAAADDGGLVE